MLCNACVCAYVCACIHTWEGEKRGTLKGDSQNCSIPFTFVKGMLLTLRVSDFVFFFTVFCLFLVYLEHLVHLCLGEKTINFKSVSSKRNHTLKSIRHFALLCE